MVRSSAVASSLGKPTAAPIFGLEASNGTCVNSIDASGQTEGPLMRMRQRCQPCRHARVAGLA
eukprot:1177799-Prymnesium_polylepis.1